jgi:hypothetical protein
MIEYYGHKKLMNLLFDKSDILELGNQIMNLEHLQGVSAKKYFTDLGHNHTSIDINGLDESLNIDLTKPFDLEKQFDFITDFGTIEHTGTIENDALYQVLKNVYSHCKIGGFMLHKNPMKGSFNDGYHAGGYHFIMDFWKEYAKKLDCEIQVEEYAVYGNVTDGWEIFAILKKKQPDFMTIESFQELKKYIYFS